MSFDPLGSVSDRSKNSQRQPYKGKESESKNATLGLCSWINPLPSGTLATFFLTAVGPIQHTKEGDISREKTTLMTSLRLERAAAVR